jgi:hypothetical protein
MSRSSTCRSPRGKTSSPARTRASVGDRGRTKEALPDGDYPVLTAIDSAIYAVRTRSSGDEIYRR